jgi:type I restriction enzyme R subunit
VIEDRIYNQTDFDRTLVLEKRSERVAQKITEFLKATDRFTKTILFCEDIDHAERMRQLLANENADLVAENHRYVMRITGDTYEGKAELDNFIDPESEYPVVVTTSRLLDTGVDAQTCKLIVLDQTIHSMTRFKQIIGRGTRINEEHRKFYFTIMDFRKATELFADPDFDGDPVQIYEPDEDDSITQTGDDETDTDGDETDESEKKEKRFKYVVDNVPVEIIAERVQYYGKDGGLVTESLRDYTRKTVQEEYESLDTFLRRWNAEDRKGIIIKALAEQGVLFEPLAEQVGKDFDPFDLICHVVFDQPLLTRRERADNVRKRDYFTKYGELARATLNALLDKYADEGVDNIEDMMILKLPPFTEVGTPIEIVKSFGGKGKYWLAIHELQQELYKVA